jgi:hypothetical protein
MLVAHSRVTTELPAPFRGLLHACNLARGEMVHFISNLSNFIMFEVRAWPLYVRLGVGGGPYVREGWTGLTRFQPRDRVCSQSVRP